MQTFGIDIGTSTIKIAQVVKDGAKAKLVAAAVVPTPQPGMQTEAVNDLAKVSEAIKKLVSDARINVLQTVSSLPESGVHVEVVEMPPMSESELSSAIVWEAEQVIPFQISESEVSWELTENLDKTSKRMKVLLAASPKHVVEKYASVLSEAGLSPQALEPESLALARSMGKFASGAGLIVGLGASQTTISVVMGGSVIVSRSIPTGGAAISRSLASYLSLDVSQAEEYKKAYGLLENQLEGKVRQALVPVVDVIVGEIRKVIEFFQSKNDGQRISLVLLTGGGAGLPDLIPYLAQALGVEVVIGDPFSGIERDEKTTRALSGYGPLYGVAVGLALREVA